MAVVQLGIQGNIVYGLCPNHWMALNIHEYDVYFKEEEYRIAGEMIDCFNQVIGKDQWTFYGVHQLEELPISYKDIFYDFKDMVK